MQNRTRMTLICIFYNKRPYLVYNMMNEYCIISSVFIHSLLNIFLSKFNFSLILHFVFQKRVVRTMFDIYILLLSKSIFSNPTDIVTLSDFGLSVNGLVIFLPPKTNCLPFKYFGFGRT